MRPFAKLPCTIGPYLMRIPHAPLSVFVVALCQRNRQKEPHTAWKPNKTGLAKYMGTSRQNVHRSILFLVELGWLNPTGGGVYLVPDPEGIDEARLSRALDTFSKKRNPPGDRKRNRGDDTSSHRGDDTLPGFNRTEGYSDGERDTGSQERASQVPEQEALKIPQGVTFRKNPPAGEGNLWMLPSWKRWMWERLERVRQEEKLALRLTPADIQVSIGRLEGHLLRHRYKTGHALAGIVVNWLLTDLREKNRRAKPERAGPGNTFTDRLAEDLRRKARDKNRMADALGVPGRALPDGKGKT